MTGPALSRAPGYPRKRSRVVWGFLECVCFCGLTSSWDMLFNVFQENDLLPYRGNCCVQNLTVDTSTSLRNDSSPLNNVTANRIMRSVFVAHANATNCSDYCYDTLTIRLVPGVTSLVMSILVLAFGIFYDQYGTLKTRLISIFMFTVSTLIMAFMSPDKPWLLFLSWLLLHLSGTLIIISNLQLANLSRSKRSLVLVLYYAARESSSLIVLLIQMTAEYSSIQTSFMFFTVGVVPLLVGTIAFLPKGRLLWPLPYNHVGSANSLEEYFTKNKRQRSELNFSGEDLVERRTLMYTWLANSLYWSQIAWMSGIIFALKIVEETSFRKRIDHQVTCLGTIVSVDHHYILYGSLAALAGCPLIGISLDKYSNYKEEPRRRRTFMCSLCWVTSFESTLVLLLVALTVVDNNVLNTVRLSLSRGLAALTSGTNTVAVATLFPHQHFGKFIGLSIAFNELISLLSHLTIWLVEYHWLDINIALLITGCFVIITFLHVIVKWKERNSPTIENFVPSNYVMETIARATLNFNGTSSLNSIEAAENTD